MVEARRVSFGARRGYGTAALENLNDFSITQLLSNLIGGGPPHSGAGHSYLSRDSALVRRVRYTCH